MQKLAAMLQLQTNPSINEVIRSKASSLDLDYLGISFLNCNSIGSLWNATFNIVSWETSNHLRVCKAFPVSNSFCHTARSSQPPFHPYFYISKLKADRPHPRDYSTCRQTPLTDNDSSLLFAALGKAEPLISTATRQKFDLYAQTDRRMLPSTLSPSLRSR